MGAVEIVMTAVSIFLLSMAILYLLTGILLQAGLGRRYKPGVGQPFVSVLVAARNEEKTLASCLDSLAANTYPPDKHEIIVIDDRSTDQTAAIAHTYTRRFSHFKLIQIKDELNGLRAKMNALAQAIEHTAGDIILITDADCRVGRNWIADLSADFNEQTAMAGGLTLIDQTVGKGRLFKKLQSLDLLYLQAVASGTAGMGLPVSILGNNFAFRKHIYNQIGGFRQIGFSLTEDMALMRRIIKDRRNKIVYRVYQQTAITTQPLGNFKEFYAQRRRWLEGGKRTTCWGFFLMAEAFITHLALLAPVLSGIWPSAFLLMAAVVIIVDFSLLFRIARRVRCARDLLYFPLFEFFFTGYMLILMVSLFRPSGIIWRGVKYRG
jgi:cellulose synthase/poly-beta-1,6-N-acetylglucosamine synthase-like glycosyltransferase